MALWGIGLIGIVWLDPKREYAALWATLSIASWVVLGWGISHFAKYRGYQGGVGCGLTALALCVELVIVFRAFNPWAYSIGFLFVVAMPIVVLLVLPKGSNPNHRRHKRKHG